MLTVTQFKTNLEKVRSLQDGWLDGSGKAPSVELLDWFEGWFLDFGEKHNLNYGYPSVFPRHGGGLVLEWFLPRFAPSLEIEPDHQMAYFHCIDPGCLDEYYEIDVNLADPADIEWVDALKRTFAIGDE